MIVDEIVDIVETEIQIRQASRRPGILGSAVIGEQVTDVLDLQSVIRSADTGWFDRARDKRMFRILVVEHSPFGRGLLRSSLEMGGYAITEADTEDDALAKLSTRPFDLVLAAIDLPDEGAVRLVASMQRHPDLTSIPVLAVEPMQRTVSTDSAIPPGFAGALSRLDRESMLRSISQLAKSIDAEQVRPAATNLPSARKAV